MKAGRLSITGWLLAAVLSGPAHAGVVQSAAAVSGPPPFPSSAHTWDKTIDQSGLVGGYVSGVTDFDTYVALQPRHFGQSSFPPNFAVSPATLPEAVDYDLGASFEILQLAFWNYPFPDSAGPSSIEVFTSNDAAFAGGTLVGTFSPLNDGTGNDVAAGLNVVQVFDLTDTTARYLRINVLATPAGNGIGWSEVAFDVIPSAIPEPQTYALLLAGLGLLGFAARRKA